MSNDQPRNLLLYDQFFHQRYQPDNFTFKNLEFSSKHGSLITAIHVTDLTWHQDGGYVVIKEGGIGFNFVKLQLVSDFEKQILLNVELFGT